MPPEEFGIYLELMEKQEDKRPQFGNRHLKNENQVFDFNAWDDVEWTEEKLKEAEEKVRNNSSQPLDENLRNEYEQKAGEYWDKFYESHTNRFFKDRHWLFTEFPELRSSSPGNLTNDKAQLYPGSESDFRIFEVGCGVGNTVFPLLDSLKNTSTFVYACDFSDVAVNLVKEHKEYDQERCLAFQADISASELNFPFPKRSLDVILMIFVLSALEPVKMQNCINQLSSYLKPGGRILFRDYGRFDMAQLRFKKNRCLGENFYVRGDGTRVYFFTQDELRSLFTKAGFVEEQNIEDKRLLVNRGRQLTMYRVWMQCKYRKKTDETEE
ncbi:tRNA N(3)-methylcytidine methyltransferase METTL2-like isoform X2 [Artemia franciscana]|uniref:tRNA N(3)-methylcytidine methyltransferase METTL2-like isoform X2 n=1 Tax=Artemia franciscana TaxID=6661 RepID=UPI0032DAC49B